MTCIVGVVDRDGTVTLGGDSAGIAGTHLEIRQDAKVFRNGEFILGICGSFRMGQLLRYSFTPPPIPAGCDLFAYMVTTFVDSVRECFKAGGYARKEHDQEWAGSFLVGVRGRLFCLEADYQVGEQVRPYHAIGCGADVARGALNV